MKEEIQKELIRRMVKEIMETVPAATSKPKFCESTMKLTCVLLLEKCDDPSVQITAIDEAIECLERLKIFIA